MSANREALLEERKRLSARLDEIDRILRGELTPSMSIHQQVMTMLEIDPRKVWTADALADVLVGDLTPYAISTSLSRMVRSGHAERVGHGRYKKATP